MVLMLIHYKNNSSLGNKNAGYKRFQCLKTVESTKNSPDSVKPVGDNLPIVQWDHDLGQYVAMGRATVSEDGAVLVTDSGSGITKAGWGGACIYDPDKCGKTAPPKWVVS